MFIRKMQSMAAQLALLSLALFAVPAAAQPSYSLADLAFLEGQWRGGDDFIFEETWNGAEGGVMTAMARGASAGELKVLEYIVASEEDGAVVMRFKHFNSDYSTWEDGGPIVLTMTAASENDVTFTADPPSANVKSIRYWMQDDATLQADIVLVENGEEGGFSLVFKRVE